MIYINKLLLAKALPFDLRMKIRRYLEYVWEQKKIVKIEEGEVMAMLNENLREKITVYLNGRILKNMKFFEGFGLDFLSELTFYFKVLTFAIDDFVFIVRSFIKIIISIGRRRSLIFISYNVR